MDKIIQLGIEARLNDIRVQEIESECYSGAIDSGRAIDLLVEQNKHFTKKWKSIINEGKISNKQFMLEQHLLALAN